MKTRAQTQNIHWWYLWAVLCFVPTLFFHYVGEEGVFTLNSMEMWQGREYRSTVMYGLMGGGGGRPPLFNWLMIPLAHAIGWQNVLVASRLITIAATLGTSFIIAWLAQQLWREKPVSWMAALLYLVTADVMLYRGWLAYADPLFSMFVVMAIAQLWVACLRNSYRLLAVAMLAAFAAFLTKAFTAYVFLAIAMVVMVLNALFRRFLLRPQAVAIYSIALILPLLWFRFGTHDSAQYSKMFADITGKLSTSNLSEYLLRLVVYPLEMLLRLMPSSLFIGYFLCCKREMIFKSHPALGQSLLIALLNFLPYWLSPHGGPRYVLPLYPFLVLPAAYLVVQWSGAFSVKRWITGLLLMGTVVNLLAYPYYQQVVRGENYQQMAKEIMDRYGQYPLYASNVSSVGLSVVANIDSMQFDKPALVWPPADFKDGIVIAHAPEDIAGKLLAKLRVGNDELILICRGTACSSEK